MLNKVSNLSKSASILFMVTVIFVANIEKYRTQPGPSIGDSVVICL